MKATKRNLLLAALSLAILVGCLSNTAQTSAKQVSTVKRVFTLTPKKQHVSHRLSIRKNETVFVKIKFLEVKGTPKPANNLGLGFYVVTDFGQGSLFNKYTKPKLTKNSIKKGNVLTTKTDYIFGKSYVSWELPRGIKKLKLQVTYYTKSGKAGIDSKIKEKSSAALVDSVVH